ncbi:uncharacterized protein LOC111350322 [Spodoptera litura]|uniref:Uncharacterized protein LOC111350322 n=1 Tax=Spodoptera litura TaxID=69820 RepID=A0A9J7DT19_SPOLT|nr:uncharacterized protein LOC111350322 [Spodoptera litura]
MAANHRNGQVNGEIAQNVDCQEPGPSGVHRVGRQAAAEGVAPPTRKPRKTQKSVANKIKELKKQLVQQEKLKIEIEAKIKELKQELKEAEKELEGMKKTAKKNRERRKKVTKRKQSTPRQTNRVSPRRNETNPSRTGQVKFIIRGEVLEAN